MNIPLLYGQAKIEASNEYYNSDNSSGLGGHKASDEDAINPNTVASQGTIFNTDIPAAIILGGILIGIGFFVCSSIFKKKS